MKKNKQTNSKTNKATTKFFCRKLRLSRLAAGNLLVVRFFFIGRDFFIRCVLPNIYQKRQQKEKKVKYGIVEKSFCFQNKKFFIVMQKHKF